MGQPHGDEQQKEQPLGTEPIHPVEMGYSGVVSYLRDIHLRDIEQIESDTLQEAEAAELAKDLLEQLGNTRAEAGVERRDFFRQRLQLALRLYARVFPEEIDESKLEGNDLEHRADLYGRIQILDQGRHSYIRAVLLRHINGSLWEITGFKDWTVEDIERWDQLNEAIVRSASSYWLRARQSEAEELYLPSQRCYAFASFRAGVFARYCAARFARRAGDMDLRFESLERSRAYLLDAQNAGLGENVVPGEPDWVHDDRLRRIHLSVLNQYGMALRTMYSSVVEDPDMLGSMGSEDRAEVASYPEAILASWAAVERNLVQGEIPYEQLDHPDPVMRRELRKIMRRILTNRNAFLEDQADRVLAGMVVEAISEEDALRIAVEHYQAAVADLKTRRLVQDSSKEEATQSRIDFLYAKIMLVNSLLERQGSEEMITTEIQNFFGIIRKGISGNRLIKARRIRRWDTFGERFGLSAHEEESESGSD